MDMLCLWTFYFLSSWDTDLVVAAWKDILDSGYKSSVEDGKTIPLALDRLFLGPKGDKHFLISLKSVYVWFPLRAAWMLTVLQEIGK